MASFSGYGRGTLILAGLISTVLIITLALLSSPPAYIPFVTPLIANADDASPYWQYDDMVTYIPFTFGWTMLLQTLRGYRSSGWKNVVIVDNSWQGHAIKQKGHLREVYGILDVIQTPVRLRFPQLQAFLDHLARESHAKAYFWSHTDILLVPNITQSHALDVQGGPHRRATESVRRANQDGTLGVMFFSYDLLSAVTTNAGHVAPWDPSMPQYGSDCDRYKRLRLSGLQVTDCETSIGEVLHMHSSLSADQFEFLYDEQQPLDSRLEFVQEVDGGRDKYAWRLDEDGETLTEMDKKASEAESEGGRLYHFAKWGENAPCELENRFPAFDI
jgi:hypothetical protein